MRKRKHPLSRKLRQSKHHKRRRRQPVAEKRHFRAQHAIKRLEERYGVTICQSYLTRLANKIKSNSDDLIFLEKESNTRTHWGIKIKGVWALAVYHKRLHYIPTFLPPDELEKYQEKIEAFENRRR